MREESGGGERVDRPAGAANDNPGSGSPGSGPGQTVAGGGAEARMDAAAMTLARLLGRRIAREHFAATRAANDNAPAGRDGPASPEG